MGPPCEWLAFYLRIFIPISIVRPRLSPSTSSRSPGTGPRSAETTSMLSLRMPASRMRHAISRCFSDVLPRKPIAVRLRYEGRAPPHRRQLCQKAGKLRGIKGNRGLGRLRVCSRKGKGDIQHRTAPPRQHHLPREGEEGEGSVKAEGIRERNVRGRWGWG